MHRLLTDTTLQDSILAHASQHKSRFLFQQVGRQFDEVIHPTTPRS
jgi:hypothetical protein